MGERELPEEGNATTTGASIIPQFHGGLMTASALVTQSGDSASNVRIFLHLDPNERGMEFDPRYVIWVRLPTQQLVGYYGEFDVYRGATVGRLGEVDGQDYAVDVRLPSGTFLSASIYANPGVEGAFASGGAVTLGIGP